MGLSFSMSQCFGRFYEQDGFRTPEPAVEWEPCHPPANESADDHCAVKFPKGLRPAAELGRWADADNASSSPACRSLLSNLNRVASGRNLFLLGYQMPSSAPPDGRLHAPPAASQAVAEPAPLLSPPSTTSRRLRSRRANASCGPLLTGACAAVPGGPEPPPPPTAATAPCNTPLHALRPPLLPRNASDRAAWGVSPAAAAPPHARMTAPPAICTFASSFDAYPCASPRRNWTGRPRLMLCAVR